MSIFWSPEKLFVSNSAGASHFEETPVFFDLDTTGLDTPTCDIVQLSAISGERIFNAYVLPRCDIRPEASQIAGFTTNGQILFLHEQPVPTVPLQEALNSFISFLRTFHNPFLVAHNAKRFDSPILLRILEEFGLLTEFRAVVPYFLDTLTLSKEMFNLPKYTQSDLVQHFLRRSYSTHNATDNAVALQDLYNQWQPSKDLVKRHKFAI